MYGLPSGFSVSLLIGHRLEIVSFSENTVFCGFDRDVSITILSSFLHTWKGQPPGHPQRVPVSESRIMQIIGSTIVLAESTAAGTLMMEFENRHVLVLYDDSDIYESYIVRIGSFEIVV